MASRRLIAAVGPKGSGGAAAADASSFSCAYADHHRAVFRVAAGLAGPALAADITQEVFVRLWRNPERFDSSRGSMLVFLLAVTRNVSIDHVRSESARHAREARVGREGLNASGEAPDAAVLVDNAEHVHRALGHLPTEMREAVVAAFFGNSTYKQVAEALGTPEGTVKSRIRNGLVRLRGELEHLDLADVPRTPPTRGAWSANPDPSLLDRV